MVQGGFEVTISIDFHRVQSVALRELYPENPGQCITLRVHDDAGAYVTMYLEANQLDIFADAVATFRSPAMTEAAA